MIGIELIGDLAAVCLTEGKQKQNAPAIRHLACQRCFFFTHTHTHPHCFKREIRVFFYFFFFDLSGKLAVARQLLAAGEILLVVEPRTKSPGV